ncbi:MAG: ABC transporter ATP-binding protein [Sphaerochaetaceae bacterium]
MDKRKIKVQVNNLSKSFGELLVLDNCNFNVKDGEFLCVVGPTGCGKSTFLNVLSNLIEPSSGEVLIDGEKSNPKKQNLSFIFQDPSAFPWLTVQQNVEYGLRSKIKNEKLIKEKTNKVIEIMGLSKYRDSYPGELSTSAEQKIVIGRSFAMQPDLLLMDEPYGQMDINTRFYLEDEVIRIWKEMKTTVIFITHNIEEAVYLAERVLILTNKPAHIKDEVEVNLPHPRDVNSPEFVKLRKYVTDQIKWW